MDGFERVRELAAETAFSGVARLERHGRVEFEFACGAADRRHGVPIELRSRFATASLTKGLTALTAVSFVESDQLAFDMPIRAVIGDVLPHVDPSVTIEHLLGHTSGVGDYLDEEQLGDIDDHVVDVPVHTLERPRDYVNLLAPRTQVSPPGERFAYNNGGYVILSMVIERVAGSFHDAVAARVLRPAAMTGAAFLRSDDLPPDAAVGYLADGRTNVFHLPVVGAGDGGIYLGLDDLSAFWEALWTGRIVTVANVEQMTSPLHTARDRAYGLGFWTSIDGALVWLEGMDAGVSCRTMCNRTTGDRFSVISNTSSGAWPLARELERILETPAS